MPTLALSPRRSTNESKGVFKMTDAEATVRFAIRDALAETALISRLTVDRAGPVIDAILASLFSPGTVWAVKKYLAEIDNTSETHFRIF